MTVKERADKIENAIVKIANVSHKTGLTAIVQGSKDDYQVRAQPAQQVGRQYIYKTTCQNGQACKGNNRPSTACYHAIAAIREVYRLSGHIFCKTDHRDDANELLNFDPKATLITIVSEGKGIVYCTVQPNPNVKDAFSTLKHLIEEKQIALRPSGQMPIAKGIQLFRRNDDTLIFRQGMKFSHPIAFWGQDRTSFSEHVGCWKLTEDAERNWEEFLNDN